jgi:hypothetical protein
MIARPVLSSIGCLMRTMRRLHLVLFGLVLVLVACREPDPGRPSADVPRASSAAITLADDVSGAPSVATLPDGGALVAAVAGDPAEVRLWHVEADAGVAEAVVVSPPGARAPSPGSEAQVVAAGRHVHVLWRNRVEVPGRAWPGADLWLATSTDGGRTFGVPVAVNDDQGGRPTEHSFQSLAAGPGGTLYAVWIDFRRQDAARAAQAKASVHRARGVPSHMPVRRVHDTEPVLPGAEIRLAASRDGGRSFGPSVVLDTTACECCPTSVTVAPDGAVVAAWRSVFPGSERDIATARSADGGRTFSSKTRVHRDAWKLDGCPHNGPSVAVADGRTAVTWQTGAEGRAGRYVALSDEGAAGFGAPVRFGATVSMPHHTAPETDHHAPAPIHAALASDGAAVWAVWEEPVAGDGAVARTIHLAPLSAPTEAVALGPGERPALAINDGRWAAAWRGDRALRFRSGLINPSRPNPEQP